MTTSQPNGPQKDNQAVQQTAATTSAAYSWPGVKIENSQLTHIDSQRTVPLGDIRLVAAEGGIMLDGGEMVIWKKTHVVTATNRLTVRMNPKYQAQFYGVLMQLCPQAVGLPYKGEARLPQCPEGEFPETWLASSLAITRRELGRQGFWGLVFAAATFAVACALAVILAFLMLHMDQKELQDRGPFLFRLGMAVIVGFVLSAILIGRSLYRWNHSRHVARVMAVLRTGM